MKNLVIGLMLAMLTTNSFALSSGDKGNGGMGVICYNNDKIESIVLLDLIETSSLDGTTYLQADTVSQLLYIVSRRMGEIYGSSRHNPSLFDFVYGLNQIPNFLKISKLSGTYAYNAEDFSTNIRLRKNCEILPVAFWNLEDNQLLVDSVFYQKLSTTDKAALWIHEAIYRVAKENLSVSKSDTVRKVVAKLLKDNLTNEDRDFIKTNLNQLLEEAPYIETDEGIYSINRIYHQIQTQFHFGNTFKFLSQDHHFAVMLTSTIDDVKKEFSNFGDLNYQKISFITDDGILDTGTAGEFQEDRIGDTFNAYFNKYFSMTNIVVVKGIFSELGGELPFAICKRLDNHAYRDSTYERIKDEYCHQFNNFQAGTEKKVSTIFRYIPNFQHFSHRLDNSDSDQCFFARTKREFKNGCKDKAFIQYFSRLLREYDKYN